MRVTLKGHFGRDTRALNHLLQAGHTEWGVPLADEDEWTLNGPDGGRLPWQLSGA